MRVAYLSGLSNRAAVLAAFAVLVAGCQGQPPPDAAAEVARPAQIQEISLRTAGSGIRYPGRVRAVQRAELTFNVSGRVVELAATEGQQVRAGDLIARLDPASFEFARDAARVEFDEATADYQRFRDVFESSGAVPRAEVERKRAVMEVARSRFATARKDLEDARLTAPFDGTIARRYVEAFQNVQAKEPVVSLQSLDNLEIVIHVPERAIRSEPRRSAGYAILEQAPDQRFPVTLKSFAVEADPQTQTYEAVLSLVRPEGVTVLPGMSAEIVPGDAAADEGGGGVLVPLRAVAADAEGQPFVWVVGSADSRVARRPVTLRQLSADEVIVTDGLVTGERIVTAGVHQLREGMLVRPL